ncbi:hypothetical protein F4859DRAFT_290941 [Xylaria cf. heliscus]|nr:hypothetical protein F4859DRAFT_290941 [Xylaria cf. heliscus]
MAFLIITAFVFQFTGDIGVWTVSLLTGKGLNLLVPYKIILQFWCFFGCNIPNPFYIISRRER